VYLSLRRGASAGVLPQRVPRVRRRGVRAERQAVHLTELHDAGSVSANGRHARREQPGKHAARHVDLLALRSPGMNARLVTAFLPLALAAGSSIAFSSAPGHASVGAASDPITASTANGAPTCSASWGSCGTGRHEVDVTCEGSVDPLVYERFQPSG